MRISRTIAELTHQAHVEKLVKEYRKKGYEVTTEAPINGVRCDILAKKGDEAIVIEVKSRQLPDARGNIQKLSEAVQKIPNAKLIVSYASPPAPKDIQIEGIAEVLQQSLHKRFDPKDFDLPLEAKIKNISGVELSSVKINKQNIVVTGHSALTIEVDEGENGRGFVESLPLYFTARLDAQLNIVELENFNVDAAALLP